jgi:hypothetical protein
VAAARNWPYFSTAPVARTASSRTSLPSARGQGEPLSGRLDPPEGATFAGVLIGEPDDRWVIASDAGYGFVVKLSEMHSRNRAGKSVLKVPEGSGVLAPAQVPGADAALLCVVSTEGKMLAFPVKDLPELPRGKGNKMFGLSSKKVASREEYLAAMAIVAPEQSLIVHSKERKMTLKYAELKDYRGERAQRGAVLPRGWGLWRGWRSCRPDLSHGHGLGLVDEISLDELDAELPQHGHRVRILDALRRSCSPSCLSPDRPDPARAAAGSCPRASPCIIVPSTLMKSTGRCASSRRGSRPDAEVLQRKAEAVAAQAGGEIGRCPPGTRSRPAR